MLWLPVTLFVLSAETQTVSIPARLNRSTTVSASTSSNPAAKNTAAFFFITLPFLSLSSHYSYNCITPFYCSSFLHFISILPHNLKMWKILHLLFPFLFALRVTGNGLNSNLSDPCPDDPYLPKCFSFPGDGSIRGFPEAGLFKNDARLTASEPYFSLMLSIALSSFSSFS